MTCDAVLKLLGHGEPPERSSVGLALIALSVIVMPTLAWAKRRVAAVLGSVALHADAAQTNLCTYLSAVVLFGLAANAARRGRRVLDSRPTFTFKLCCLHCDRDRVRCIHSLALCQQRGEHRIV